MGQMKLSVWGRAFIAREEGCVLHPYNDSRGFSTIGVGHLLGQHGVTQAELAKYARFTQADALDLLVSDAARFERAVNDAVRVPLEQHEFDALICFAFNVGTAGMAGSSAVKALNAGHRGDVPALLLHWSYAGTQPVLHGRRVREGALFAHGIYGVGIQPPGPAKTSKPVPVPVPPRFIPLRPDDRGGRRGA